MKENIFLIINKKNNILDFSIETEKFANDLLENINNEKHFEYKKTILSINYIYNYLLNIFLKYKFYLIFLIIFIIFILILKKITLYFLYINNGE